MDVTPANKEQLAIERKRLPGATVSQLLLRWHRSVNMMSGAFVLLVAKPERVSLAHLDEWLQRLADMSKDMTALRKKLQPRKRRKL
jgi:selenocysteine-specific translation elongation factor